MADDEKDFKGYRIDPDLDRVSDEDYKARPTDLDFMANPALREEHKRKSIRQTIQYSLAVPAVTILAGIIIIVFSKVQGGPKCVEGSRTLICSRLYEILFPVVPGSIAFLGVLGAAWICYRKWKNYDYWGPWFGAIWFLIPFCLTWLTGFGTMAIVGQ